MGDVSPLSYEKNKEISGILRVWVNGVGLSLMRKMQGGWKQDNAQSCVCNGRCCQNCRVYVTI